MNNNCKHGKHGKCEKRGSLHATFKFPGMVGNYIFLITRACVMNESYEWEKLVLYGYLRDITRLSISVQKRLCCISPYMYPFPVSTFPDKHRPSKIRTVVIFLFLLKLFRFTL